MAGSSEHPFFNKYFASPEVAFIPRKKRNSSPRIFGVSKLIKRLPDRKEEHGIFVTKPISEECIKKAFCEYGQIKKVRVLDRYAFVLFEDNVDLRRVFGKTHDIDGKSIYVDKIMGQSPSFLSSRDKKKANIFHNRTKKFKQLELR